MPRLQRTINGIISISKTFFTWLQSNVSEVNCSANVVFCMVLIQVEFFYSVKIFSNPTVSVWSRPEERKKLNRVVSLSNSTSSNPRWLDISWNNTRTRSRTVPGRNHLQYFGAYNKWDLVSYAQARARFVGVPFFNRNSAFFASKHLLCLLYQ